MTSAFSTRTRLPNETWKQILEFATHVPGELDTTHATFMDTIEEAQAAIVESYELRRTIVLVSKLWNSLGTPILYRSIVIRELERAFPSLNAALKRVTHRTSFADVSYVRRLDINPHGEDDNAFSKLRGGVKVLIRTLRLLRQSPRVRIVNLALNLACIYGGNGAERFLGKLCDCLTPNLELLRIDLGMLTRFRKAETISVSLPHHTLEAIALQIQPTYPHITAVFNVRNVISSQPPSLSLSGTSIPDFISILESMDLNFYDLNSRDYFNFLDGVGQQLESLEIAEPSDGAVLQAHLEAIAKYCPRLDTLVINKQKEKGGFGYLPSLPMLGIQKLGYRIPGNRASQDWYGWNQIFDQLERSCEMGSKLKEFHVLSPAWIPIDIELYWDLFGDCASSLHNISGVKVFFGKGVSL